MNLIVCLFFGGSAVPKMRVCSFRWEGCRVDADVCVSSELQGFVCEVDLENSFLKLLIGCSAWWISVVLELHTFTHVS